MSALGRLRWIPFGLTTLGLLACGSDATTLAKVGHQRLEIAPFQEYVADVTGEAWQAVSAVVSSRLLDQYLDRFVVIEAARIHDVHAPEETPEIGPTELQWLLDEMCGLAPDPTSDEIADEVARRLEVVLPAQAHVRQILVDSHETALSARERLLAGEDFLVISREMSRAPNAMEGGELGFFDQGSLTPEIDRVIFGLETGQFSDPVLGPSGYHVFQVLEIVPAGSPNRLQIESEVRSEFAQHGARIHTRKCVGGLAGEIGVEIKDVNLWFPYSGRYVEGQKDA